MDNLDDIMDVISLSTESLSTLEESSDENGIDSDDGNDDINMENDDGNSSWETDDD